LLESAGFTGIHERDITADYLATARALLYNSLPHRDALAAVDGEQQVDERLGRWHEAISASKPGGCAMPCIGPRDPDRTRSTRVKSRRA
jgi:hypothetical protein